MAMTVETMRQLVALDPADPLSRFGLGKKLLEERGEDEVALQEAAAHLRHANETAPQHLATYHVLADVLVRLKQFGEAREVLMRGIAAVDKAGGGMGRDLGPVMRGMLANLPEQ
jgi:hypothetical protein